MEFAVLIHRVNGTGYRAATGDPLPAAAEGASREEALGKLRMLLEEQVRGGAELVRLRIAGPQISPSAPVWPDDALTRDWLSGIAEVRRAADQASEPWADTSEPSAP